MVAIGMFGGWEILAILAVVLILFGPGRLPEVFSSIGKGFKSFKDAQSGAEPIDVQSRKSLEESVSDAKEV